MMALPAQMSNSGGRWSLYVPLMNTTATAWPGHVWNRTAAVPTVLERERVLNGLGYESVPGDEWSWIEDSDIPGDPASPVRLIAAVRVRPLLWGGVA
ncbi:DUF6303 family protein [Streptomyces sp. NBC_00236]|uniref:DUF6303 family protein n=1 Tax=Streptomyces sp. NBC_00236 TaxID=2903639 RepID=UPI002E2D3427|nr:DUF6303 family protein [Streptomyces sp. NBC_00236]